MRTTIVTAVAVTVFGVAAGPARAVCDGDIASLNVPAGSTKNIALPADGRLDCTTVNVAGKLTFTRNARNTPVFVLATGDIVIPDNAQILLGGQPGTSSPPKGGAGGPGGFDGGDPGINGAPPGDGHGPGAGAGGANTTASSADSAGTAAYGAAAPFPSPLDGSPYGGPLLVPLVGGSGGGGLAAATGAGCGGGGGGGAILLSSATRITLDGEIDANPGFTACGGYQGVGSGGAVRLVAPTVEGAGTVNVVNTNGYNGGPGRIRVDTIDRSNLRLSFNPTGVATIGAFMSPFGEGNLPHLDVVNAAGTAIADGSGPVIITLPFNSPSAQTVTVKATSFTGSVPIDVVVVPASGARVKFPATINMNGQATAQAVVPVQIPQNVTTRIWAWTR